MSELHLRKGSLNPPKVEEKLRLYSMKYCPFAQRVRLVLLVKKVPHDIVNIDIFNKPEWLFTLNPLGLVPILNIGTEILTESLDICDYLDKEYPEPPLYSKDETRIHCDKTLMKYLTNILPIFYEMSKTHSKKSYDEHMEVLIPLVQKYETELDERGTLYFGGDEPHMIDYMLWPFAERAPLCGKSYGREIPGADVFPRLYSWCAAMRSLPVVEQIKTNLDNQRIIFEKLKDDDFDINFDLY